MQPPTHRDLSHSTPTGCFALPAHFDRTKYRYCCCSARLPTPLKLNLSDDYDYKVDATRSLGTALGLAGRARAPRSRGRPSVGRARRQTHAAGSMLPARPPASTRRHPPQGFSLKKGQGANRAKQRRTGRRTPISGRPCVYSRHNLLWGCLKCRVRHPILDVRLIARSTFSIIRI